MVREGKLSLPVLIQGAPDFRGTWPLYHQSLNAENRSRCSQVVRSPERPPGAPEDELTPLPFFQPFCISPTGFTSTAPPLHAARRQEHKTRSASALLWARRRLTSCRR